MHRVLFLEQGIRDESEKTFLMDDDKSDHDPLRDPRFKLNLGYVPKIVEIESGGLLNRLV